VILVRQRRAEQRHDAVAHDLVHRALVAMDGLHHVLEHWVEDLARVFGIAVGEEFHRSLQIGEQDGNVLALSLQRGLRGHYLLGEVRGRVRLGSGEAVYRLAGERGTA
jgi:hypothetical protein